MKLSVLVPVYNEVLTVKEALRRIASLPIDTEIVVVDDGSSDGSARVLATEPGVRVITHPVNRGKGAAIRTALAAATGDAVVVQDADLEYSPAELPRLLAFLEADDADVVYGSRFKGSQRGFLFSHYLGNLVLNLLTNILYSSCLTDMETCYKVMRRDVALALELESERFEIEPEITAKVLRRGYRLLEVPITFVGRDYKDGKKIGWRDGVHAIWALVKWRFRAPGKPIPFASACEDAYLHQRWVAGWPRPHLGERLAVVGAGRGVRARAWLDRSAVLVTGADEDVPELAHRFRFVEHVTVSGAGGRDEREWGPTAAAAVTAFAPDTVLFDGLLARAADPARLLAGLAAAVKPGTRLVVMEPAGDGRPGQLDTALGARRTFPPDALQELLRAGGFTVRDIRGHDPLGGWVRRFAEAAIGRRGLETAGLMLWDQLLPLARGLDLLTAGPGRIRLAVATRDG